ncbi:MAG: hypothetical protein J6Y20_04870 [Lachnospiraceae bacterium]|nr:hypothetical protein [Kiritimatiellia bacterium]MBP5461439.1 hypothetical protein [Lachnospiraceae bacterium]
MDKKFEKNIKILEDHDVRICSTQVWEDKPNSVELELFTDAGGDMIICLEEPTKECLQKYIEDFDIDEEVMLWWSHGRDAALAAGVPFDNTREHYEDLESWLKELQEICDQLD